MHQSSSHTPSVFILLASYNGENFIAEQINSILTQTYSSWTLLIRDDGSTDTTLQIIQKLIGQDTRITLLNDVLGPSGSATQNFSHLMEAGLQSEAEYFFFSDQDDLWHPEKIAQQLQVIESMDNTRPCLAHHDLEVVDDKLNLLHASFFHRMRLRPNEATFSSLLGRNEITGGTMVCNRKLLEYASPIPEHVIIHDWWLALICAATGNMKAIDAKLIKYRQHSNNEIGAKPFWDGLNPFTNWKERWEIRGKGLRNTITQAKALEGHFSKASYAESLGTETVTKLNGYISLLDKPKLQRIKYAKENNLLTSHWLLRIAYKVRLLIL